MGSTILAQATRKCATALSVLAIAGIVAIATSRDVAAVINGVDGTGLEEAGGFVKIDLEGEMRCSATLIRNDLILTARHCTTERGNPFGYLGPLHARGDDYTLYMGSQSRVVSGRPFGPDDKDFQLLQVSDFFSHNGSRFGLRRSIYGGSDDSLVGQSHFCAGYGFNSHDETGLGVLRFAGFTADFIFHDNYGVPYLYLPLNDYGQLLVWGDSGGGCLLPLDLNVVTGVITNSDSAAAGLALAPSVFRSWIAQAIAERGYGQVQSATGAKRSGAFMYLDDIFGKNIQVTANWNPSGNSGVYNNHHVAVRFDPNRRGGQGQWAVVNMDRADMPEGASFNVVANAEPSFAHYAGSTSSPLYFTTILDDTRVNGDPDAVLIVTQRSAEVDNNHPIGVYYDGQRWGIYNADSAPMPERARFNVWIADPAQGAFVHRATADNTFFHTTYLDNVNLNGQPDAHIFVTHNYNPGGGSGVTHQHSVGVWYDTNRQQWAIFNQDFGFMRAGVVFNVHVRP